MFIYLLAAPSLCCPVSFLEQRERASLGCSTQASCGGGFSRYGAWALGRTGFISYSLWALKHGLLRKLYACQEATVRTGHGTTDWFQIGKGVCQGYILSSCLFNFYAEYIMRNAGLEEAQAGIKIAGRNINNLRCQGPAQADPGSSKRGWHRRGSGYNSFN